MPRRGRSTTIGKIAQFYQDRRASEIRALGEVLRREQRASRDKHAPKDTIRETVAGAR